jgi:hypothetical protein
MDHLLDQTLEQRCLALTGSFETSAGIPDCYCGLAGDFDGMGLSYGALQWNLGQGTLQPLLADMLSAHADLVAALFGEHTGALKTMLAGSRAAQLTWARSIQDAGRVVIDPWKSLLLALGRTPEFQAVQVAHAGRIYQNAVNLCRRFGVNTERAVALMFDIAVQNGGIDDAVEEKIRADFAFIAAGNESARLQAIANRRAEASSPRYIEDVRVRKLTIAHGTGTVHQVWYDLAAQFGIRLVSAFA